MRRTYWAVAQFSKIGFDIPGSPGQTGGLIELGLRRSIMVAERVLHEVIDWLCRAQDHSASADGGVARDYSLIHGWATSYPETTGYIIPTFLAYSDRWARSDLASARAANG